LARVPFSVTAHANDIFNVRVQADDLRRKLSDAAAVVTVSDYHVRYLQSALGAATRLERVYYGLDLDRFPFQSPQERPARIVAVGRLVEKKGFADLVNACAILARRGRRFSCQIIGTGALEASLRAQIARCGLERCVELLGPRPQPDVITSVLGAAAMAAPCVVGADGDRDGLPNVVLEAMALGTPCISTDVTGIPEVLRDEETGLRVPQHDPAALAMAIERLLGDSALRVRLAANARRLIEAAFDIHRNAESLRAVFFEAVRAAGKPGRAARFEVADRELVKSQRASERR
jgi:glycosyltransferase involved in cell wall biosynthesis